MVKEKYPERFGEVVDEKIVKHRWNLNEYFEVSNVSKSFGGVKANVDISMNVEKGRIVGLIGPWIWQNNFI